MSVVTALQSFLCWWWEQICALRPPRWHAARQEPAELVVVFDDTTNQESSRFRLLRAGEVPLGTFGIDETGLAAARTACAASATACLRLPPGLLLAKRLVLPAAAERDITRILAYEIDRETPFSAAELWWSVAIDKRTSNQIAVRLVYVPRTAVAHLVATVERIGLRLTALDGTTSDAHCGRIEVAPAEPWRMSAERHRIRLATVACLLLAIAAAVIPFGRQALVLRALDRRIAALRPAVAQADVLRRKLDTARTAQLAWKSANSDDPLAVLATLTAALPDDAYLDGFLLRDGRLTLNGHARDAAALIDSLSALPALHDPKFLSPVTITDGRQAFAIGASARSAP